MLIRRAERFKASDVTDETLYLNRRAFIAGGAAAVALGAYDVADAAAPPAGAPLKAERNEALSVKDAATKLESATTYNNFYEFGVNKDDPAREAHRLKTRPWTVAVEGLVHKPKTYDIDELIRAFTLEERVYVLRCVEAWSMVIPWIGFPLGAVLKQVEPTSQAKFVEFTTLLDPVQFPGQKPGFFGGGLEWPYVEGLRLDEALHPLPPLTLGMYGQVLPHHNGAPGRILGPWEDGFQNTQANVGLRPGGHAAE